MKLKKKVYEKSQYNKNQYAGIIPLQNPRSQ